jgi:hypothetical protein
MSRIQHAWPALLALALMVGCSENEQGVTQAVSASSASSNRTFTQRERLANPLVSEVTVRKARHGLYNRGTPSTDVGRFSADVESFITGVAGRDPALADAISGVLLPDMLLVYPRRNPASVGWLSWAFGGYGGRALPDDVVDIGLMAIFGGLLGVDLGHVSPGLSTDNVANNDAAFAGSFPYLAAAH